MRDERRTGAVRGNRKPAYINHIVFVLDASSSMTEDRKAEQLIKVADAEIAHLASRSQELNQETRVTVYTFADGVECVIYDQDVMRLPSIKDVYAPYGNTALIAATAKTLDDLKQTGQLYGDHAFLVYVLTDGQENCSHMTRDGRDSYGLSSYAAQDAVGQRLAKQIDALPDNWTVACLVPDEHGVRDAVRFGFPRENVAQWNAKSAAGVLEVGGEIRRATESYMTMRSTGVRGTRSLFSAGGADQVNRDTMKAATRAGTLQALNRSAYALYTVDPNVLPNHDVARSTSTSAAVPAGTPVLEVRPYVEAILATAYTPGCAFYELTKSEKIQPQKQVAVRNRKSGRVYSGDAARQLLDLPDHEVKVKPDHNDEYQIFVQSTSVNRRLVPNTKLLVML